MITTLAIKNYALIEDIQVDLTRGMTIITGETGAGKSILLGALSLLLGKRADLSSVKDPTKKCTIEGEFSVEAYALESMFETHDMDYDHDTIIRREILPSGKSRAFVNDTPVSLSQLQTLGLHLVDVHSQHETLTIVSENFQIEVIDAFAGTNEILENYSTQLKDYRLISEEITKLKNSKDSASKELDYHTFLYNELDEAKLEEVDQQELEETFETLNNTEVIQETLAQITHLLSKDQIGTLETAKEARINFGKLRDFSGTYKEFWDRLNSIIIELEDIFEGIEESVASVEANPSKLLEVNEKLQTLYKLQQKHTVGTVIELLSIKNDLASKIDNTLNLDERISVLEKKVVLLKEQLRKFGKEIHEKRSSAIPKLKKKLEEYLKELGLPNGQFRFDLETSDTFRKNGIDTLDLKFTANKGLAFGSLKKVASGGEMSRIMLAVKAVLAQYKKLPTIIFDEIDSGVSGEIANKVALILSTMSRSMQLLCITHLPQIASKGEYHLKVYKKDVNEITQTQLRSLNEDERIVEIAQMIGGSTVTDAALANAKELLN